MAARSSTAAIRCITRPRPCVPLLRLAAPSIPLRSLHLLSHSRPAHAAQPRLLPSSRRNQSSHRTHLTEEEYHKLSDAAMDNMLESLEEAIDAGVGKSAEEGWEVSYSSGVLTLSCGPHGTYVLNKQPPNLQIWLSSPASGPKRYDYGFPRADTDDSATAPPSTSTSTSKTGKEGEEGGKEVGGEEAWFYHRDGSTLKALLERELSEFAGERVEVWVEKREEGR